VEIKYADGRVVKHDDVDSRDCSIDGDAGDEIDLVMVKSGTTREPFACDGGPKPFCPDGIDNDGNGLIDFPADPSCSSPEDTTRDSIRPATSAGACRSAPRVLIRSSNRR
jgi:hypothetical protein